MSTLLSFYITPLKSPISTAEGADCNSEIISLLKSVNYATWTDYKNNRPPGSSVWKTDLHSLREITEFQSCDRFTCGAGIEFPNAELTAQHSEWFCMCCKSILFQCNKVKNLDSTILNNKHLTNFVHGNTWCEIINKNISGEGKNNTVYTSMDLTDGDILNALQCFMTHFNIEFSSILKCSVT